MDKVFKGAVYGSMVDYPGHNSSVLFVGGCNWNCEYCHNTVLLNKAFIPYKTILEKLESIKPLSKYVAISGGEPTIYGDKLVKCVKDLHSKGYNVGLYTNGSNPNVLLKCIPYLDYVSLDLKTDIIEYAFTDILDAPCMEKVDLCKSVDLSFRIVFKSNIPLKYVRTTLYDKYVTKERLVSMCEYLKSMKCKNYVLQECRGHGSLDVESKLLGELRASYDMKITYSRAAK